MKLIKQTLINKNIKQLSQIENLKISKLDYKNSGTEYPCLTDDLVYRTEELLEENKIKIVKDFKVYYSLNNSQGDGFQFNGVFKWNKYDVYIKQYGHYYHSNAVEISINDDNGDDVEINIYDEFKQIFKKICCEVEIVGYSIINDEDEYLILKYGFIDFCDLNNLSLEFENVEYSNTEKDGFIKISESGNTRFKGLWIKDLTLCINEYEKMYTDIEIIEEV